MDSMKCKRFFSSGLWLLVAQLCYYVPRVSGQQGVSLMFLGTTIPNDSFVDLDDVLNIGGGALPSSNDPRALVCLTDLEDCCAAPRTVRGDWYFPYGTTVGSVGHDSQFVANRGANDGTNQGSVRLFRRYSGPPGRGRFHCELPNAANPSVDQIIYVNILQFGFRYNVDHVIFSPSTGTGSTTTTAGRTDYSLTCSATLFEPSHLPSDVPSPNFQWSFNNSASLPSGVTATPTVMSSSNSTSETYTSTLQFSSPLSQSVHTGIYTCGLGPGRLVNSIMVTVNAPTISAQITASGPPILGQSYSLTCTVSGAENLNPSTTYQWTNNNGTQIQIPMGADPKVLSFSSLRLSDAGWYTCQTTVSSPYLNSGITMMDTQDVRLQIPAPTSVMLSSNIPNPIPPFGSSVTLTCHVAVELSPAVDVPVTVNTVWTSPEGATTNTTQPVMGSSTGYAATFTISSFGRSDSGVYICGATVSSPSNAYISDSNTVPHSVRVTTGVYLALRGVHITNNSNINITNIGLSSDSPNGALQCITDHLRCCSQNPQRGEWYLPNGALVQGTASTIAFYRNRGANGEVSLNRPSGVESPSGLFCCEVPDATSINQILCVIIGGVSILSIPSDPPIAGESYTLEFSTGGSQADSFQWLGPPDGMTPVVESIPRLTISSVSTSSQLQFRPVQQSDNGSYSCSATVGGLALTTDAAIINANAPAVSVQIGDIVATPTAGENYLLTCSVTGAENLNPTITYRWIKNSGIQVGTNSNTLFFTPLQLSDAASYVCEVTIRSSYLTADIVVINVNPQDVSIRIPAPSSLKLASNSESVTIGYDTTLICTLELDSDIILEIDLSLLVIDAQLSRDGTPLAVTGPTVTGTTFTYTTQLNSFGRSDSGNYTCTATIIPQSSATYLSGNETIQSNTVGIRAASAPPENVVATQSSSSAPLEISWSPPMDGASSITGYRVYYSNGQNVFICSVTIVTSINLKVDGNYIGQNVSIRSEADELYSDFINVTVTVAMNTCSCASEIGIAVGAVIVVVCLIVIVTIVIVILCLWRRKSYSAKDVTNDFAVSANMAYGEVHLKPREAAAEVEYENPDTLLKPSGQGTDSEVVTTNMYETMDARNLVAPEYVTTEEAVCSTNLS